MSPPLVPRVPEQPNDWLTKDELATYWKCPPRFVERVIAERRLRFYKLGKKYIRVRKRDADRFLWSGKVEAQR